MNYYQLGEYTMPIFKNMFSSAEKFLSAAIGGLISLYSPVYVPIIALAGVIVVNTVYGCKVNKKFKDDEFFARSKRLTSKIFYKLRDAIVAICGAFTIEKFIVTSIDLHAIEFIAGAIALVEFFSLLEHLGKLHPKWKIWNILKRVVKKKGEQILDVELDEELSDDTNNSKVN